MADEAPVAQTLEDLTGSGGTPPAPEGSGDQAAGAEGTPPSPAPAAPAQNMVPQSRLDALTADKWNAIRRAEAAEAEAALLRESVARAQQAAAGDPAVLPPQVPSPGTAPRTYTQDEVQREAQVLAANQEYLRRCQSIASQGRTAHPDFDTAITNLNRFGPLPQHIVEAAEEAGDPAEVLYALGQDMQEMDRIFSAGSPMKQAAAVVRYGAKIAAAKRAGAAEATRPSGAPAPIDPATGGRGPSRVPSLEDPDLPMAEWIKLREKQTAGARR